MPTVSDLVDRLIAADPYLNAHRQALAGRLTHIRRVRRRITEGRVDLVDLAAGHEYFGLHRTEDGWIFREWAPNATAVTLIGDFSAWRETPAFGMSRIGAGGQWEIRLPTDALHHGDLFRLRIHWDGGSGDRIPAYARRVVQDAHTTIFNAQVWRPEQPYRWRHPEFRRSGRPPLIYEVHVGMAQAEARIGTWREFTEIILPRVVKAGYDTIQLMAVQEHPYSDPSATTSRIFSPPRPGSAHRKISWR